MRTLTNVPKRTLFLASIAALLSIFALVAIIQSASGLDRGVTENSDVKRLRPEVVASYPHDEEAFTQGLLIADDELLESTGLRGESTLRRVDLESGDVLQEVDVEPELFAEGLAQVDDRLIQLTWQSGVAIVYQADTFTEIERYTYDNEGWGLCHDGTQLVMSDGSSQLHFRDQTTFAKTSSVDVTLDGEPVKGLNELECVDDSVYANVWQTDQIVVVDPSTGDVTAEIDATGLLDRQAFPSADVLNGIAYDEDSDRFYLTGKHWPTIYEVRWVTR